MDGSKEGTGTGAWQLAGAGLAMFLGVVVAAVAVAQANLPAPRIGDILVMRATGDAVGLLVDARKLAADGSVGATCVLDPGTMARSGGSLVVEARAGGAHSPFVVHWAGGPTSDAATDCGSDADLALEARDLTRLSNTSAKPGTIRNPLAAEAAVTGLSRAPVAVN